MRYLVLSDVHANLEALTAVIDAAAVPRLKSATARVFVPDSVFDHTSRFVAGVATRRP